MSQPKNDSYDAGGNNSASRDSVASHHEQVEVVHPEANQSFLTGWRLQLAVVSVCSASFLVFGYDQGVMSGVVVSDIWLQQMGNPSATMIGTIVAIYDIGAILGCIGAAVWGEVWGRRKTLIMGCVTVIVGMLIMVTCYERIQMMVGRVVTGIGIGFITSVAPVYLSETSTPKARGWHMCCQMTNMLLGLLISYWVNYGLYNSTSSFQWRFPLAFQAVFALYVIILTPFLPDSPRWYMRFDKSPDYGTQVIANLRGLPVDHDEVQQEKAEIMKAITIEHGGSWGDLFRDGGVGGHKRFMLALGIQFMQQLAGINIVTYYAPTIFQDSIGLSHHLSLLLGGLLNVWYIIASFGTWYVIDRIGRRKLLISQGFGLCLCLVLEAVLVAIGGTKAGIAAVVFIFVYETFFTWGWMATVWSYPPEILPLKLRAKGSALAAGAEFLSTFMVVEITPPALENIGYKTYIIFAVFNLFNIYMVWTFFPETAKRSLESIDMIFIDQEELLNEPWYAKLQWNVVRRSTQLPNEQLEFRLRTADPDVGVVG